jgi:myo-inositol-1(or 4)-monophosphatase
LDELERIIEVAGQAAREAGGVLQSWASRFTVSEKGPSDLVTEADLASQAAIVDRITAAFPDHDLLGEENLASDRGRSSYRWIIDPLDGTSNYVHRFPYYCVSIGVEREGSPVAGAIYDPNRDELFLAATACGAPLNGAAVRPSRTERLDDAFLVASLPRRAGPADPAVVRSLRAIPA